MKQVIEQEHISRFFNQPYLRDVRGLGNWQYYADSPAFPALRNTQDYQCKIRNVIVSKPSCW